MAKRDIPNTNEIQMYMHCAQCLEEKPADKSPQEWSQNEVGWTTIGLQVWCKRHGCNVCHVDFEGHKHPANTTRQR
jgi:hypothetical protein